jgi:hypothetical protein
VPTRLLKEGMLDSDAMNSLSDQAEVFYRRLFQVVDDYGRFDGRLDILRFRLFPLKTEQWPVERVKDALEECTRAMRKPGEPLIRLYMSDGKPYVEITKFDQRRRTKSKYPDPPLLAIVSKCEQPLAIVRPVVGVSEDVGEYEVVDEGVVGDGDFRLDDAVAQFREKYQTFNPQGLQSPKVETAYADIVFSMTRPREEHRLVLEGLERMVRAGPKHKLGAVNFILDKRYRDPWELEVEAMKGPRSAEQMMKEMGI